MRIRLWNLDIEKQTTMEVSAAACWMLIIVSIGSVSGKPVSFSVRTQKRQSDQRVAELETLLALQKYGAHHHFLRAQSQDTGGSGLYSPGYGIIDFNKIGRKKKASPPSLEVNDWALPPLQSPSSNDPSNEMMSMSPNFRSRNKWSPPSSLESANSDDTDTMETDMEN